jgi:hypothetical protein
MSSGHSVSRVLSGVVAFVICVHSFCACSSKPLEQAPSESNAVTFGVQATERGSCPTPRRVEPVHGVCVLSVVPGGVADRAGVRSQDILVRFGATDISNLADLGKPMGTVHLGDRVPVVVLRLDKVVTLQALFAAAGAPGNALPPQSPPKADPFVKNPALRKELLAMAEEDQKPRQPGHVEVEDLNRVDAGNRVRLKEIVTQYGWPTISLVGLDGANAAWLLAQHADGDRGFQASVLAMMEPLVKTGEASAGNRAYLYDRIQTPQRYGTQGNCTSAGSWVPKEIEDPEPLDRRRAEVGLEPMADYVARFKTMKICPSTPPAPAAQNSNKN